MARQHPSKSFMSWKAALFLSLSNIAIRSSHGRIACTSDEFCASTLRKGSRCDADGFCDNPYQSGCLQNRLPQQFENKLRICHSEDPPDAADLGICRKPPSNLEYPEVRIMSQNWESPFFEAWILQILLSEVLDVPTTIETGLPDKNVNFYDPQGRFDYGVAYDMDGLERASNLHDCRKVQQVEGEPYKGCGHAILEIWHGQEDVIQSLLDKKAVERKSFIGLIGEEGWQVPKYTADKEPSLMSWFGLAGDENRRKLADMFLRPTTWGQYCEEVSLTGCQDDSDNVTVALRPPQSPEESEKYFQEGLYTGHFRKTEENNCDKWPKNCTGHFLDYPCGWTSFFIGQVHHLNIGLKSSGDQPGSGGYSYARMTEVWYAANWTRSDVFGWWWRPESLYQQFQGTDFELQRVTLPPSNYKCIENRLNIEERCSDDDALRVGNRDGVCDVPPIPNYKLLSTGLHKLVHDPDIPPPLQSPAYEVLKDFTVNGFDLGEIFAYWLNTKTDKFNFDSRDAVCRWVSENLDELRNIIPLSHPRVVQETPEPKMTSVAISLGVIAGAGTLISIYFTYRQRSRRAFQFAQVEFVFLLLMGMLLCSTAAILTAVRPTDVVCITTTWMINLGYTLELVPLVVKIAAINRLMQAARRMKRIKLNRVFLLGIVAALFGLVCMYLIIWTALDPPSKQGYYELSDEKAENGEVIVAVSYSCQSKSLVWTSIAVGSQALLLLCASILAFLTRKMRQDVNEANTISFLIYWNFVCVLLRVILLLLRESVDVGVLNRSLSMILSADSLATILIYFLPKFLSKDSQPDNTSTLVISFGLPEIMRPQYDENYQSHHAKSRVSFADKVDTSSKAQDLSERDDPSESSHGAGDESSFQRRASAPPSILRKAGPFLCDGEARKIDSRTTFTDDISSEEQPEIGGDEQPLARIQEEP